MRLIITFPLLISAILLVACTTPGTTQPAVVSENPPRPTPKSVFQTAYPQPTAGMPVPTIYAYPPPATPSSNPPVIPRSGFEPQPGDNKLRRDEVTLDMANSHLVVTGTGPFELKAYLIGNLPDPHHTLRVVVTPPNAQSIINIEVYALVPPGVLSTLNPQPFTAEIPLGSYATALYTVNVNGEKLGKLETSYAPQPGDENLSRGEVNLEASLTNLITSDSQPKEVSVNLEGYLPDPCHQLRIVMTPADSNNKINLVVYSVFDAQTMCIMVIQPFQVAYPLGSFSNGHYSVYVNGQLAGEFDG